MNQKIRIAWLLAAVGFVASSACKVDREEFHAKLWSCNPSAADPACGTDIEGAAMTCVAAYQLGGRNFCASSCDRTQTPTEDNVCVPSGRESAGPQSGARLRACSPATDDRSDGGKGACGSEELQCLRTDLVKDEGVCLTVATCSTNSDCRDPVRAVCMGQLLRDNYGEKAQLKSDHTYCVQGGCRARKTACSPGETCLRDVLPRTSRPSDICVPNCDANNNCPANYLCFNEIYSKIADPICIPGLLGFRCRTSLDCLLGECVATSAGAGQGPGGNGINMCMMPCEDDKDCAKYDSEHGTLFCAQQQNGKKFCTGARAYNGWICNQASDCLFGETCARVSSESRTGNCFFPCNPDGSCPSPGGVNHTCVPQVGNAGPPVCLPGQLGRPCRTDGNCIRDLTCRPTGPGRPNICSTLCSDDTDCEKNRFTKEGFCHAALKICVVALADDAPCERDAQCESKKCVNDPAYVPTPEVPSRKKCDKTPGY